MAVNADKTFRRCHEVSVAYVPYCCDIRLDAYFSWSV
jgi:hypothetical protein